MYMYNAIMLELIILFNSFISTWIPYLLELSGSQ